MAHRNKAYKARKELERYHKRRAEFFDILGSTCAICRMEKATELDHVDRKSKSFNISSAWSMNRERILEELRKCQPVCFRCHTAKSRRELSEDRGRENNPAAKLDEAKVALIRKRHRKGSRIDGARALGRELGVSHQTIRLVVNNETWQE